MFYIMWLFGCTISIIHSKNDTHFLKLEFKSLAGYIKYAPIHFVIHSVSQQHEFKLKYYFLILIDEKLVKSALNLFIYNKKKKKEYIISIDNNL